MISAETPQNDARQSLSGHLVELRRRLLWAALAVIAAMGVCLYFVEDIYGFLVQPLADAMGPGDSQRLIYTNLTEAFMTYLKVGFFAGLFVSFPVVLYQLWRFVAPALYKNEQHAFAPYLIAAPALFFLGGAVVYYVLMPMAWPFFLGFQSSAADTALPIRLEARVGEYLDLVMLLIFSFGLCFQLPVVLVLLGRSGLISASSLAAKRKFAIILAFIVGAVMTPPDILSQIALALPIILLYEISILLIRRTEHHDAASPRS